MNLMNDIERILISKEQIAQKVKELGEQISRDYRGKRPLLVCILKGSVVFYADLVRAVTEDVEMDFMAISSYGSGSTTSGEVRLLKDMSVKVEGRDLIIVEDIIDSGVTLNYLVNLLHTRGAESVEICTLLDKPARRQRELNVKYKGFVIENKFIVGYGLDYDERYRNLPDVCVLKPEIYE